VWAEPLGTVNKVGMEGADSFGPGLRFPAGHGLAVIEVDRPGRAGRRRNGKSHPHGTESAARRSSPAGPSLFPHLLTAASGPARG
jgi:transposase